jgi:hypothetical protein
MSGLCKWQAHETYVVDQLLQETVHGRLLQKVGILSGEETVVLRIVLQELEHGCVS